MSSESGTITDDVHLGLRFWVEIDGIEIAGFAECSGLSVETEVFEYAEGGWNVNTHKLPGRLKYGNITLKRGINPGGELFAWFKQGIGVNTAKRKNLTITVYSPSQVDVKHWQIRDGYPVKWVGPDLKADSGVVAIETLEIVHNGFLPPAAGTPGKPSMATQIASPATSSATQPLSAAAAAAVAAKSEAAAAESELQQAKAAAEKEAAAAAAAAEAALQKAKQEAAEAEAKAKQAESEAAAEVAAAKAKVAQGIADAKKAEAEAKKDEAEAKKDVADAKKDVGDAKKDASDAGKDIPKI